MQSFQMNISEQQRLLRDKEDIQRVSCCLKDFMSCVCCNHPHTHKEGTLAVNSAQLNCAQLS